MAATNLTSEELRALLDYRPETGLFIRRSDVGGYAKGSAAGSINRINGYVTISVSRRPHYAHRLAWLYVHGAWPPDQIDHINGIRTDNRIANLRAVDRFANTQNLRQAKSNSKTGLLGVSAHQGRWRAFIHTRGKTYHLGLYDTQTAAHAAYVAAKRDLHAGCTL